MTTTDDTDPPDTADEARTGMPAWLETVVTVVGALVIAFLVQAFVVKPFKVPSGSMLPTIREGQRILANRIGNDLGDPKDGQVLVFTPPAGAEQLAQCQVPHAADQVCLKATPGKAPKQYVKRVVGVPGDRLQIVHGHVIRNGRPVVEPYARTCDDAECNLRPFTVPGGTYFMMGDNRGDSNDSRYWGPLPRNQIIGRAFATYWPPKRIGGL
ncbi:MAG: signal peptidase I [Solirubrobacteraceae bacterium]|nr:signal peptidase I [Patulibacter sp.]